MVQGFSMLILQYLQPFCKDQDRNLWKKPLAGGGFALLRSHIYFYFTFELVFQESPLKAGSRLPGSSLPEPSADV